MVALDMGRLRKLVKEEGRAGEAAERIADAALHGWLVSHARTAVCHALYDVSWLIGAPSKLAVTPELR